eukprot:406081-Prorocentrum_lima.AAC.1
MSWARSSPWVGDLRVVVGPSTCINPHARSAVAASSSCVFRGRPASKFTSPPCAWMCAKLVVRAHVEHE